MPTYKATGYDRETGKQVTIEVEARCQEEARDIAYETMTYPVVGNETARAFLASGPKPKD